MRHPPWFYSPATHSVILRTSVVVGAVSGAALLFGSGVAVADDYAGKTYSEVSAALSSSGKKGVIASVVGGRLSVDQCRVTSSRTAPFIRDVGGDFERAEREVMLSLNCNAAVADAKAAGYSAASPEGRAAIELTNSPSWRRQNPEWCNEAKAKDPASTPFLVGCFESESE